MRFDRVFRQAPTLSVCLFSFSGVPLVLSLEARSGNPLLVTLGMHRRYVSVT